LKRLAGKDIYAVGGATLVSALMNAGLIDEVQLAVQPVVLGSGKALFKDVRGRQALRLLGAQASASGTVRLTYAT
jgi:dihydrofolate reductase